MTKLDKILEKGHLKGRRNPSGYGEALDEAKQQIKDLMLEIIGEPTWLDESKNEWTRALRRRINEL